mmetsp:Transcript_18582/g.26063  ORF Transcript_18582/g.26063 Transcript_18582/m.26063 type:complete len:296 (+) Transcript_18582:68-955(+)
MDPNNNPNNQGYNVPPAQPAPYAQPVYYVPNQSQFQNPYYQGYNVPPVQPAPQSAQPQYVQNVYVVPPQTGPTSSSVHTPLVGGSLKEILTTREYEVQTSKWLGEAWTLYKDHWLWYSFAAIVMVGVSFIPYVGGFLAFPISYGIYLTAIDRLRSGGVTWDPNQFVHGYYYFFPLLLISILYNLLVIVGFFLLIIPGFYFLVTLSYWAPVWLEFRRDNVGIMDAMTISRKQLSKNFCGIVGWGIILFLLQILGLLCFLVGIFVTIPVSIIAVAVSVRDIFGYSSQYNKPSSCICC